MLSGLRERKGILRKALSAPVELSELLSTHKLCCRTHLLVLLHSCIELLGQIICYIWHPWLLLVSSAHAALVLISLLVVLLFGILAISLGALQKKKKLIAFSPFLKRCHNSFHVFIFMYHSLASTVSEEAVLSSFFLSSSSCSSSLMLSSKTLGQKSPSK